MKTANCKKKTISILQKKAVLMKLATVFYKEK